MCWTTDKFPISKTAFENITCYKIFHTKSIKWKVRKFLGISLWKYGIEKLYSLYKDYKYIPYAHNPEITVSLTHSAYWDRWYIDKGYHSYNTLDKAKEEKNLNEVIVKCIIPKGSEYYINEYDEIVSSNIIVTNKIIK